MIVVSWCAVSRNRVSSLSPWSFLTFIVHRYSYWSRRERVLLIGEDCEYQKEMRNIPIAENLRWKHSALCIFRIRANFPPKALQGWSARRSWPDNKYIFSSYSCTAVCLSCRERQEPLSSALYGKNGRCFAKTRPKGLKNISKTTPKLPKRSKPAGKTNPKKANQQAGLLLKGNPDLRCQALRLSSSRTNNGLLECLAAPGT